MVAAALLHFCLAEQSAMKPRLLRFSGYDWEVKSSEGKVGPGPNYFDGSTESAFVDSKGRLHLKVRKSEKGWTCSEVVLSKSLGYGRYTFTLNTEPEALDDNLVLGLFTYADDTRELDVEVAKWGSAENSNAQFVVQPYDVSGNTYRFDLPPKAKETVASITWLAGGIDFLAKGDGFKHSWRYEGPHNPKPDKERAIINLWLMNGKAPKVEKEYEVVISKFLFSKARG